MPIRLKLTLWYSGLLAVTLVVLGASIYYFVDYYNFIGMKKEIKERVDQVSITASPGFVEHVNPLVIQKIAYGDFFVQVVDYSSGLYTQSSNLITLGLELPMPPAKSKPQPGFVKLKADRYHFLTYQKPLYTSGAASELVGLLQIAMYTDREERILAGLRTILIFASAAVLLIAFSTGLLLARQGLRPIENVIRAANQIENGSNLSIRIPRTGPSDELGRLTDTINGMLARLETTYNELDEAYRMQRRFVSDASHELRTPLTTIRGNIELLEKMWQSQPASAEGGVQLDASRAELSREAMQDIADETRRMSRLVGDLLSLARADAGYMMEKSAVPLLPLAEEVARRAQHLPRTADWVVGDLSALEGVSVSGNADYLRQLLFIFIENAFKYTPNGEVELSALRHDGQAGIVIRDTGIGMDRGEVPHIFERFYRADESRGKTAGTGLGLSIAKWIIDEHGGSVEVETREGAGTAFTVWLPVIFHPHAVSGIMEGTEPTSD